MMLVKISPEEIRPEQQLLVLKKSSINKTMEFRGIDIVNSVTESEYFYNSHLRAEEYNFSFKSLKNFEVYKIQGSSIEKSIQWFNSMDLALRTLPQHHDNLSEMLGLTKEEYLKILSGVMSESRSFLLFMDLYLKNHKLLVDIYFEEPFSEASKKSFIKELKSIFLISEVI